MTNTHEKHHETPELIETENEVEARARIFQAQDCKEVLVDVPEWGMSVLVRALTGTQRAEYFTFNAALRKDYLDSPEFYKQTFFEQVRLGVVHPRTKKPIFQRGDQAELMDHHNGGIIEMLAAIVRDASLLNGEVTDLAKKKLQGTQSSSATTNSQNDSGTNE